MNKWFTFKWSSYHILREQEIEPEKSLRFLSKKKKNFTSAKINWVIAIDSHIYVLQQRTRYSWPPLVCAPSKWQYFYVFFSSSPFQLHCTKRKKWKKTFTKNINWRCRSSTYLLLLCAIFIPQLECRTYRRSGVGRTVYQSLFRGIYVRHGVIVFVNWCPVRLLHKSTQQEEEEEK